MATRANRSRARRIGPRVRRFAPTIVSGAGLVVVSLASGGIAGSVPTRAATSAAHGLGSPGAVTVVTGAAAATGRLSARVVLELVPGHTFGVSEPAVLGRGIFNFAIAQGHVRLQETTGTETVVFLEKALYVRQPSFRGAGSLPAGKTWIAAGLTESPASGSSIPQFVDQVEAVNTSFLLNEVTWGAVAARPLGTRQIAGSSTEGFDVTVDLRRAVNNAVGSVAAVFSRAVGYQIASLAPGANGAVTMHVRAWVTSTGRIVQLSSSPPGSGVGSISVTLSRFGTAVRIDPPPTSQTVDIATLTPGGEQESGLGDVA